jgi:hypothetical protein
MGHATESDFASPVGPSDNIDAGNVGSVFPEGDQPNPDDDLWKELDGVFGCPAAPFGAPRVSGEVLWFKGQAALPQARETVLPRESGHHAGPNI